MDNKNNEGYIDLSQLLRLLFRKSWLIAVSAIVCATVVFLVTFFLVTPQ